MVPNWQAALFCAILSSTTRIDCLVNSADASKLKKITQIRNGNGQNSYSPPSGPPEEAKYIISLR